MIENPEIDALDLKLLEALQSNARSTFAELGDIVGLKASSVHDRVKRLEARGYVRRYSAQLDGQRLGLGLTAFVSCYTSADTGYDEFNDAVKQLPEVCEVHSVAGEETYFVKVMTRSTAHLDDFLTRLKQIKGLVRSKTMIVLSTPFERGGIALGSAQAQPMRRLQRVS